MINVNSVLQTTLAAYGDVIPLSIKVSVAKFYKELKNSNLQWEHFGDLNNQRFGIALNTHNKGSSENIIGGLQEPALGEVISDEDFTIKLESMDKFPSLEPIFNIFREDLGRTRIVRLDNNGHFHPHRDHNPNLLVPAFFRLLLPLRNWKPENHRFLLDERELSLDEGRLYFLNTLKKHSLVSFSDEVLLLMISIRVSEQSVLKTIKLFQ